jgi:hypothetical protein
MSKIDATAGKPDSDYCHSDDDPEYHMTETTSSFTA